MREDYETTESTSTLLTNDLIAINNEFKVLRPALEKVFTLCHSEIGLFHSRRKAGARADNWCSCDRFPIFQP